jgi:SsrA-binding protein
MKTFKNRKARHDYFFVELIEAGIVLKGTEIKSIRAGKVSFKDSFAKIKNGEVWLYNMHISPYEQASLYFNHDPERPRKLLLSKREIRKLSKKTEEEGYTLIPAELYINNKGLAKIKLALAKGKKNYDKREDIKKRDEERINLRKLKDF